MAEQNSYRWYILAASFLILVIDGGVRFSFGVLIKPLASESRFGVAPGVDWVRDNTLYNLFAKAHRLDHVMYEVL